MFNLMSARFDFIFCGSSFNLEYGVENRHVRRFGDLGQALLMSLHLKTCFIEFRFNKFWLQSLSSLSAPDDMLIISLDFPLRSPRPKMLCALC